MERVSPYYSRPKLYYLSTGRLRDVIVSMDEVGYIEMAGMFSGRKDYRKVDGEPEEVIVIDGVFPFQIAKRTRDTVTIDENIIKRKIRSIRNTGKKPIGGYHSHGTNLCLDPSKKDIKFANDYLAELGLDYWFELILGYQTIYGELHDILGLVKMNSTAPEVNERISRNRIRRTKFKGHTFWKNNGVIRGLASRVYTPERLWLPED